MQTKQELTIEPYLRHTALNTVATAIVIVTVSLMSCLTLQAQTSDSINNFIENNWIEKMGGQLAIDVSFNNSFKTFGIETATNKILLYPNTPNNLRLNVNYDFISVGVQWSPDFLPGNGDNDLKGTTKSLQLGATLVFKHWFSEVLYSKVSGYYLKNTADFNMNWTNGDPFTQFPNLNYTGISISAGYIHNSKFSLRSLTTQTERQLKNAGSFMPVFNADYYVINDQSNAESTQKTNNIELSIGPGYAYTFVFKERFYTSLGLFGSIGYLNTKLTTRTLSRNVITNQDNFILRGDGKAGIGYNGSQFYTGLYTTISGTRFRQENTSVMNTETRWFYHLFIGFRLDAPKFLKQSVQKAKTTF